MAQTYNQVTHTSGSQVVGNVQVTVTASMGATTYPGGNCGTGPYHIGNGSSSGGSSTSSGYTYVFNTPVRKVRFQLTASNTGEEISFFVNGSAYPLTSANLSNFAGTCGSNGNSLISLRGTLVFTGSTDNNTTITLGDSISSVSIFAQDTIAGSVFNMHFVMDTTITMSSVDDTLLCVGDTLEIPYQVSGTFASNNQFIFQLSDKHGSFVSPKILATINGTARGLCKAPIPYVTSDTGYRIRVVATNPVYVSAPLPKSYSIGNKPIALISNTGPACNGSYAQLAYRNFTHFTEVRWSRQGKPAFSKLQYYGFSAVTMADSGMYIAEMDDYGCHIFDSTRLIVKPNPLNAISTNNSPVCMDDTLLLSSSVDTPGALNVWVHPDGNRTDSTSRYIIPSATYNDTGKYVLITMLDGCIAFDTTLVAVHHKPVTDLEDINTCIENKLHLQIGDTNKNVSCIWKGPNDFVSYSRDTVIMPVNVAMNGSYVVTASIHNCITIDTMEVLIKLMPPKPIAPADTTICTGKAVRLSATNIVKSVDYSWKGPSGFFADTAMVSLIGVTTSSEGYYSIVADMDGCIQKDSFYLKVIKTPDAPIVTSNSPVIKGGLLQLRLQNKEADVYYRWQGPGGFLSGLLNPDISSFTQKNTGTYTLLAERNGCINSGILQVQLKDIADTGYVLLYPNPNNGNFTLKGLFWQEQKIQARITNAIGQEVYWTTLYTTNKQLLDDIRLSGLLANGAYQLQITIDGSVLNLRFVVSY